jgi:hypothetical protein
VEFTYCDTGRQHDLIAGIWMLALGLATIALWGSRISEFSLITLAYSGGMYGLAKAGVPRIRCEDTVAVITFFPGLSNRLDYGNIRQVRLVGESKTPFTDVITLLARSRIPPFYFSARPRLMLYLNHRRWFWFALPFPLLLPSSRIRLAFSGAPALYKHLTMVAGVKCESN